MDMNLMIDFTPAVVDMEKKAKNTTCRNGHCHTHTHHRSATDDMSFDCSMADLDEFTPIVDMEKKAKNTTCHNGKCHTHTHHRNATDDFSLEDPLALADDHLDFF